MTELYYQEAHKLALKEYKRAVSAGESPYPAVLDDMLKSMQISSGQTAAGQAGKLEQIPLLLVTGTKQKGRMNAFARNFMPLLDSDSEFAAKWKDLCDAHLAEGIREPVKLYEYRNRFYVQEGNKRVSVLKYFDADSIDAQVITIPSLSDGSEESLKYDAFRAFFEESGLRTVEFSAAQSYEILQDMIGKRPGEKWTENDRKDFELFYYYFHRSYSSHGGDGHLPTVCDAMLEFLMTNDYRDASGWTPDELDREVKAFLKEKPGRSTKESHLSKDTKAAIGTAARDLIGAAARDAVSVTEAAKDIAGAAAKGAFNSTASAAKGIGKGTLSAASGAARGTASVVHSVTEGTVLSVRGVTEGTADHLREHIRVLAVADDESKYYYDYYRDGILDEFDLILACGDLSKVYLEFLTTMAKCPVLYIRGNHDDRLTEDPPGGCECIEDKVFVFRGLRIAGLGGSFKYKDGKCMYTEAQMKKRALKLVPSIIKHKGVDILMTHAPAKGINDFESLPHQGFETFNWFMEKFHPKYMIHGHMHMNYGMHIPRFTLYDPVQRMILKSEEGTAGSAAGERKCTAYDPMQGTVHDTGATAEHTTGNGITMIINAYDHCAFDIEI